MKVGVLMGGPSSEHAISLKSGRGVGDALTRRGWNVHEILIPQELSPEQAQAHVRQAVQGFAIDVVFIALHGPFGEDGTVQQTCEALRVAYTGSDVEASRLGMDKVASRRRFEEMGLIVPKWRLLPTSAIGQLDEHVHALGFPLVVKPTNQGSSIGVSLVRHHGELQDAVELAARYDSRLLLEEFVRGRELTVGMLGDHPLPVVEIQPQHGFFDFTAKYTPGQTVYQAPAKLDTHIAMQVQRAGAIANRALGCRHVSRVDLIFDARNQPVVLEVNTIPGLTPTSLLPKAAACVGISYDELCERMVLMAQASGPKAQIDEDAAVGDAKAH